MSDENESGNIVAVGDAGFCRLPRDQGVLITLNKTITISRAQYEAYRAVATSNAEIVAWWENLPPKFRQDIEGSGNIPGCIARAKRHNAALRAAGIQEGQNGD